VSDLPDLKPFLCVNRCRNVDEMARIVAETSVWTSDVPSQSGYAVARFIVKATNSAPQDQDRSQGEERFMNIWTTLVPNQQPAKSVDPG
jgi:hypothetical protein